MADIILANDEKIAKFAKINSLQNYPLYGNVKSYTHTVLYCLCLLSQLLVVIVL